MGSSALLLKPQDVEVLAQSDGFCTLREHMAQHYTYALCNEHSPEQLEDLPRWLLVRDVLHALLVPIVELFDKAVSLSLAATRALRVEDLEYAFTGQARNAFLWLRCFLCCEKEREWCYTRGCPVCVVEHSLNSEFSVRLLFTACLLSDVHYPFTLEGPTLPSFMFFLDSLERALAKDPLYGRAFFDIAQPKAVATRDGIEELIHQCVKLEAMLSTLTTPSDPSSHASSTRSSPTLAPLGANTSGGTVGLNAKGTKMARRQLELQMEESNWTEEMLRRCWDRLEPQEQGGLVSAPVQHCDAVLKAQALVAVDEVNPDS